MFMKQKKYSQNIYVLQLKYLHKWNLNQEKLPGTSIQPSNLQT